MNIVSFCAFVIYESTTTKITATNCSTFVHSLIRWLPILFDLCVSLCFELSFLTHFWSTLDFMRCFLLRFGVYIFCWPCVLLFDFINAVLLQNVTRLDYFYTMLQLKSFVFCFITEHIDGDDVEQCVCILFVFQLLVCCCCCCENWFVLNSLFSTKYICMQSHERPALLIQSNEIW